MLHLRTIKYKAQRGFTLLEVLLVVAIIAILAGIVIIAINPGKNLQDTRNAQRQEDVTTILDAVYQYSIDFGSVPATITAAPTEICKTGAGSCTSLVDLSAVTSSGKYIAAMPIDPQCPTNCNANGDGYKISKDATTGRITVTNSGINVEGGKTISVTR
ncbi:MAG TPA: type II secretion system protein [Candidatus Saccharimonadales bacterium]|nr:type II secretion system protein [Candidatus Saccharimonadales bacterium]